VLGRKPLSSKASSLISRAVSWSWSCFVIKVSGLWLWIILRSWWICIRRQSNSITRSKIKRANLTIRVS